MATPSKRQCLDTNGDAGPSKNHKSGVQHTQECRGTIEEADLLAETFLKHPELDKSSSGITVYLIIAQK
jgi:hypothetical protein